MPVSNSNSPDLVRSRKRLLRLASLLTVVLLCIGYFNILWLPFVDRGNFFDENALLIGSAASTIRHVNYAPLDHALHMLEQEPVSSGLPSWLPALLASLPASVDWSFHNFTQERGGSIVSCQNFHVVLRAPTTDGTDSILLATPLGYGDMSPGAFVQTPDAANLALALGAAMVTHLSTVRWLARDIIWLVPDGRCGLVPSVQAWVDTYRMQAAGWDALDFHRGGLIRQALVLEVPDHRFARAEVAVEGFDGRLPNLDLYWVVTWLAANHLPIPVKLQQTDTLSRWLARQQLSWDAKRHLEKSISLLNFMWRQAKGTATGAHAPLLSAGVDALTLRLVKGAGTPYRGVSKSQLRSSLALLLDVTEGTIRGCNNLLESLHHSYKLYLQSGRDSFVSIDMYIIPFAALFLLLVVQISLLQMQLSQPSHRPSAATWIQGMKILALAHVTCTVIGLLTLAAPTLHRWLSLFSFPPQVPAGSNSSSSPGGGRTFFVLFDRATQQFAGVARGLLTGALMPGGGGGEGELGESHAWSRVAGAVLVVAGAIVVECAWALRRVGAEGVKATLKTQKQGGHIMTEWRVLRVLMLCSTAMGGATIACINWSLAIIVVSALLPVVLLVAPVYSQQSPQQATTFSVSRFLQLTFWVLASWCLPAYLGVLVGSPSAVAAPRKPELLSGWAGGWDCSALTYMVVCSLYAPVVCVSIWLGLRCVD